jgi:hypothetical protein
MKYLKLFFVCLTLITAYACKKKPEACITASKTVAAVNEDVTISSCSKDADRYFWTMDTIINLVSPPVIDNCTDQMVVQFPLPGNYEIKLEALTYSGVKLNCNVGTGSESDETSIWITVQ